MPAPAMTIATIASDGSGDDAAPMPLCAASGVPIGAALVTIAVDVTSSAGSCVIHGCPSGSRTRAASVR